MRTNDINGGGWDSGYKWSECDGAESPLQEIGAENRSNADTAVMSEGLRHGDRVVEMPMVELEEENVTVPSTEEMEEVDEFEGAEEDIPLIRVLKPKWKGKARAQMPSSSVSAEEEEEYQPPTSPAHNTSAFAKTAHVVGSSSVPTLVLGSDEWLADPAVSELLY